MQKLGRDYTPEELIELLYNDRKKKVWIAYALLITFGSLGGHRSYLQFVPIAVIICIASLTAFATFASYPRIYYISQSIVIMFMVFDCAFIPAMVRQHNKILRLGLESQYKPTES